MLSYYTKLVCLSYGKYWPFMMKLSSFDLEGIYHNSLNFFNKKINSLKIYHLHTLFLPYYFI